MHSPLILIKYDQDRIRNARFVKKETFTFLVDWLAGNSCAM